jgi:YggT family protein
MVSVLSILDYLLSILAWIIIIQVILSWLVAFNVINTRNDFVRTILVGLERGTEPIYRPIRKILPDFGGIDFSPFVVLIVIKCLQIVITNNISSFY